MIVVADTSVLVNLCRIGRVDVLQSLFRQVVVPQAVIVEFQELVRQQPRFAGLSLPDWIKVQAPHAKPSAWHGVSELDAGEAAAITLALEIHAAAVLLDERRGAEIARKAGLEVIGILGVLLRAKRAGHLPAIKPELARLRQEAGFWLSDAVQQRVLQLAGESG